MTRMKYTPVKRSLKDVVGEYAIEITAKDASLIHGILGVLDSGVEKLTLKVSQYDGNVVINENDYKSIQCTNVKVNHLSDKGDFDSISDAKAQIQSSIWSFPCPDYHYDNIKRNLEKAICVIHHIRSCNVEDFSTGIVEYTSKVEPGAIVNDDKSQKTVIQTITEDFVEGKKTVKKSKKEQKSPKKKALESIRTYPHPMKIYDVVSKRSYLVDSSDIDSETTCEKGNADIFHDNYGYSAVFVYDSAKDATPNKSGMFVVSDRTYNRITTCPPEEW